MRGSVNANLEATLPLRISSSNGQEQEITIIVDTGFSGSLSLSEKDVQALGLNPMATRTIRLADGCLRSVQQEPGRRALAKGNRV